MKGKWKQLKGAAKVRWGKLTDDDLEVIDGQQGTVNRDHPGTLRDSSGSRAETGGGMAVRGRAEHT
jgi:hypothetical protein